jgi:hypothetical protein
MKKSSSFEWHRWFKEGWEDVLAVWDRARVFLRSQGNDSSLWIHCTRTKVNRQRYLEVLIGLQESVWRKRPQVWPDKRIPHTTVPLCTIRSEFARSWLIPSTLFTWLSPQRDLGSLQN